jgi:hypothetical protein
VAQRSGDRAQGVLIDDSDDETESAARDRLEVIEVDGAPLRHAVRLIEDDLRRDVAHRRRDGRDGHLVQELESRAARGHQHRTLPVPLREPDPADSAGTTGCRS